MKRSWMAGAALVVAAVLMSMGSARAGDQKLLSLENLKTTRGAVKTSVGLNELMEAESKRAESEGVGRVLPSWNPDVDGDGVMNARDNCPDVPNADQENIDGDRAGDACDDSDGDGWMDEYDCTRGGMSNVCLNDENDEQVPLAWDDERLQEGDKRE